MKVPDLYAAQDFTFEIFTRDKSKPAYFKLVLFQKSPEACQQDLNLNQVLFNSLSKYAFFEDMNQIFSEGKSSFEIINGEYLNILEFIIKAKPTNSWLEDKSISDYLKRFYFEFASISLPNNWMLSCVFMEKFGLDVGKVPCVDLEVESYFQQAIEEKPILEETTEEKTKRLLELRREMHGAWSMLFIDGNIPSLDVKSIPVFQELFGIDMQIKMMLTSIIAAFETRGKRKAHTVLFGPAGCGKTTVLDKLDDLLGKDNVVRLDAPCMTKSGLETLLLEMKHIPAVIIIEEIEKCSENNLRTLLGIMDERSEICKTTVAGSVTRNVESLIFATVNDIEKFNKYLDGALSSRFKNKIFFPRPSEETIKLILERDIKKNGGKNEWVKPTLDFAKELNVTDPRMILSWLINGDRLLDGSFQKDFREMEKLRMESGYAS